MPTKVAKNPAASQQAELPSNELHWEKNATIGKPNK